MKTLIVTFILMQLVAIDALAFKCSIQTLEETYQLADVVLMGRVDKKNTLIEEKSPRPSNFTKQYSILRDSVDFAAEYAWKGASVGKHQVSVPHFKNQERLEIGKHYLIPLQKQGDGYTFPLCWKAIEVDSSHYLLLKLNHASEEME